MRTMRSAVAGLASVGLSALLPLAASPATMAAQEQQLPQPLQQPRDPYPATLQFGTGLISIPVAWVSPRNTDAWLNTSGRYTPTFPNAPVKQGFASLWNTNITTEIHFLGRVSAGVSVYDQNPDYGFFGQALLLRDDQFAGAPAIAVGVRNIGNCKHEDRMLLACDVVLGPNGYRRVTNTRYADFNTMPTLYGVATKDFTLGAPFGTAPYSTLGLTVGYGGGIFSDDGNLGKPYNQKGTIAKGLFLGARYVMHPTLNTLLTAMA